MDSENSRKYVLVGLPSTGKTTFIVALWHALVSRDIEESLVLDHLEGDTAQLSKLRDLWIGCEDMPRTKTGFDSLVSLSIRETTDSQVHEIIFPDANGENFRQQWIERYYDQQYSDLIKSVEGVLLFVNCGNIRKSNTLNEVMAIEQAMSPENGQEVNAEVMVEEAKPWDAAKTPTQVQLVELLQFIQEERSSLHSTQLRLAVIVSAWDIAEKIMRVKNESYTPAVWLSKELPLFWQFLKSNPEIFAWRIYGLSAQGGDIKDSKERIRLQELLSPSERIIVREGNTHNHDISEPLRWMLNLSKTEHESPIIIAD